MEIRETTLSFSTNRGSGPQRAQATLVFPRQVTKAVASIRGYQIGYVGYDHHVGRLQVVLETEVNANVVIVKGRLGCRDWSGSWDDEYNGTIQVSVFVDLAAIGTPTPRDDLQIVDLEINQAIQYFRSSEHLDAANVRPDNSIPLIANKMTGLRFYIDYDASLGSPISTLSGEVTIRSRAATTTLAPLAVITPRHATEINRGEVGHTLNFAIPGAWCHGTVEIVCEVFDQASPARRSSAFMRTLRFVDVNPMRVQVIGINYTGAGLNLAAPTLADFDSTFDYVRRVWPTGQIISSSYNTLQFSEDLSGVASQGCGNGFNALLDQLRDFRGNSDDLVYGLLPTGTPLTGVGGCGGGGVAAGRVNAGVTAAHEAGHAYGQQHSPCDDSVRCDNPRNQDGNYPEYGNYMSDSIGEFGYDPANNSVMDPASTGDIMSYTRPSWVSPYTYRALLTPGDPVGDLMPIYIVIRDVEGEDKTSKQQVSGSGLDNDCEWIREESPVLFVQIKKQNGTFELLPSFTFPSKIYGRGKKSDYKVRLVANDGTALACTPLLQDCLECVPQCGPTTFVGELPWFEQAERLVLSDQEADIQEYPIETKPEIRAQGRRERNGNFVLSWETQHEAGAMWYLVQWEDGRGVWRGVAPRTQQTQLVVPKHILWATPNGVNLRVLGVHLLNTAECVITAQARQKAPPPSVLVHYEKDSNIFRASAFDAVGRSLPEGELMWFDESGAELVRGAVLRRQPGQKGVATVRQVASGVVATEGFALLDSDELEVLCGSRPASIKAKTIMKDYIQQHKKQ